MSAFLVDEMFPPSVAALLRDTYGHDAVHVIEIGLQAVEDAQVAAVARSAGRARPPRPYLGPHWPRLG